jgi:hypothetical protein
MLNLADIQYPPSRSQDTEGHVLGVNLCIEYGDMDPLAEQSMGVYAVKLGSFLWLELRARASPCVCVCVNQSYIPQHVLPRTWSFPLTHRDQGLQLDPPANQ